MGKREDHAKGVPRGGGNSKRTAGAPAFARKTTDLPPELGPITDSVPALISYVDREYRYRYVNRTYSEWFGKSAEEIVGRHLSEVLGEAAFEKILPEVNRALAGETLTFNRFLEYRSGGSRYVRITYTPDLREGKAIGFTALVVDVSEQFEADKALIAGEERYRAFIEQSSEGIWRFELEEPMPIDIPADEQVDWVYRHGYLAECNDAMARQYGLNSASQLIGVRLADLLVKDDPNNTEFLRAFFLSGYRLNDAESHERDPKGNDRFFLNNFVGFIENGFLKRAWGTQRDITESKAADRTRAHLAAIVEFSDDAIVSKDINGIVTSWNEAAERIFGFTSLEMVGQPIKRLIPEERIYEEDSILARIRNGRSVEHFETQRRKKDGSLIDVSLTVSPIRDPSGEVIGASKVARDISQRRETEAILNENRLMLAMAMQSSRMGVWELDLATNTVSWSEELEEIFGLEKGGFGGTEEHFFALMHEDDREAAWIEVRRAISEHRGYIIEFRFHHADGSTRWMEGRGEAVYSQKGEPVRLYGVGIDITARKESEKALSESEQRFSRFMQQLPGLAWIKDITGKYVYANEAAERSFGVSGPNLYGKTDGEVFPAETAEQFVAHDQRALESGTGIQVVESMLESDGVVHFSVVSKFPIAGADGKPALIGGMAIDITDQKHAEEALRRRMEFDEAVMTNMGEGLYTVDAEGRVTSMNPAAEKLFGWTFEELKGRRMHDATHYCHRDGTPFPAEECEGLRVIREGEVLVNHDDVFIRKDGTFFDVLYSSSPIVANGQTTGLVVVFQDVTERKRQERNHEFLLRLGEQIRRSSSEPALFEAAVNMLGEHFGADRVFVTLVDTRAGTSTVINEYCAGAISPLKPVVNLSDYSDENRKTAADGKTVVVSDTAVDARTAEYFDASYKPDGIGAYVAVPLMRDGHWAGMFFAAQSGPYHWDDAEVSLIQTVAERMWLAVEKVRSEKAMRESEERFRLASDAATALVYDSDLTGRRGAFVYGLERVTGYSPDESDLSSEWWHSLIHEDDLPEHLAILERHLRSGGMYRTTYRVKRKDGRWIWVEDTAQVIQDADGNAVQLVGTIVDISTRREAISAERSAREALIAAERKAVIEYQDLLGRIVPLAETLGGARDLVTIYRSMQEFICASMECSGFFISFYDTEHSLRQPAYVWGDGEEIDIAQLPPMPITPEGGPNSQAILEKRTIITDHYWDSQRNRPHVIVKENGRDPMSSIVVPMIVQDRVTGTLEVQAYDEGIFHREQAIALEMAANLAAVAIENVRLIQIEATARAEAEAANRMKDEFLSVLSHELRTPLNAMLGWVRILRGGNVDEARAEKALEIIERNTRQQSSLIEDLLDVSRIISGKMKIEPELIDLVPSIHGVAESFRPLAGAKGVDFSIKGKTEPLYMKGDAVRLQQVITNLLQNAVKFTPAGGKVTLSYKRHGSRVIIKVRDTGEGIQPEFLPMIFDRFSQADATTRRHNTGLGLGLTIVRNIIELHGGKTSAASDGPGTGTTMTVELVLAEEFYKPQGKLDPASALNGHSPSLDGFCILVVDDDPDSLLPLRILLEREKATVYCATSAEEALERLGTHDFHILISDIGMPSVDGFQLISRLRKDRGCRNSNIKAIAFTAYASDDDRERALSAGYHAHLAKPLDIDELIRLVRNFAQVT